MSAIPVAKHTVRDYLEIEKSTGKRYDFFDDEIFEVDGASIDHNQVLSNVFGDLFFYLKNKPSNAFTSQLKVESVLNNSITYPDITVVCGEIEVSRKSKDIVTNPTVIIEVVSPSTGDYDHGEKFFTYRLLPSLKEYILISSVRVLVEKYTRESSTRWTLDEYRSLENVFLIESIGLQLNLLDVYANMNLPFVD